MNSVIVTLCVTVGRVFFDSLAGYALARSLGRRLIAGLFVGTATATAAVRLLWPDGAETTAINGAVTGLGAA